MPCNIIQVERCFIRERDRKKGEGEGETSLQGQEQ